MGAKEPTKIISQSLAGTSYTLRASPSSSMLKSIKMTLSPLLSIPVVTSLFVFCKFVIPKKWHETIVSGMLPRIMLKVDNEFRNERRELLRIGPKDRVLDVGSGGGAYLAYCAQAKSVVAVEPVEQLHSAIRDSAEKHSVQNLTIVRDLKDLLPHQKEKFDWVILGNVLCEVPCVETILEQIDMLLASKGKVYFCEHVACDQTSWKRYLQNLISPMWRTVSLGCTCNRDSIASIRQRPTWQVVSWHYDHRQVFYGPFVIGLAAKE